ncbi:MAG: FeoA family protein [Clostridia bacterium]|nr:FeoA family protein [Clostridia bacterium]
MLPLSLADIGTDYIVKKIGGNDKVKKRLTDLGFTVGGHVTVVSAFGENIIVNIRESRVGIDKEIARKIFV